MTDNDHDSAALPLNESALFSGIASDLRHSFGRLEYWPATGHLFWSVSHFFSCLFNDALLTQ